MRILYFFLLLLMILTLSVVSCSPRLNPVPSPAPSPSPSITPTPLPVLDTITGSFQNQISSLENDMPRSRSEGYVIPTHQEQEDFATLISRINTHDLVGAATLATRNNYGLTYYIDQSGNEAISYLLREEKPIQKGWGLYAFRKDSTSNIIIEAPHPLYDRRTPSVALDIYRAVDARALLIAGAHRHANRDGSADVAHTSESIFQSVHMALSQELQAEAGDVIILQIHGFHSTRHKGYPEVVFGLGKNAQAKEVALAEKIKEALAAQGISAGVCVGDTLKALCAETNAQSAVTKEGIFLHIELDEKLRKEDSGVVAALVEVFSK
ncbi:MAG TPA: hypothetical protein VK249_24890 [Anaerolineales bacterium]|nr:hypothetical protein [Anaerolineales bacterium]